MRESQEIVELALKGLLRHVGVEAPHTSDVSDVLQAGAARLPASLRKEIPRLTPVSRDLRRDRELAFYGAEDLTPSSFYSEADATQAREGARLVVHLVQVAVPDDPS